MQLSLSILQPPEAVVWENLTDQQRQEVIAKLAVIFIKYAKEKMAKEEDND